MRSSGCPGVEVGYDRIVLIAPFCLRLLAGGVGRGQCWGIAWDAYTLHQPSVRDGAHTPEDEDPRPS